MFVLLLIFNVADESPLHFAFSFNIDASMWKRNSRKMQKLSMTATKDCSNEN
jgi:hypothetical protein